MQVVAAVEGKLDDARIFDDGSDGGILSLKLRSLGTDFDGFRDLTDSKREVQSGRLLNLHRYIFGRVTSKTGLFDSDIVLAGRQ